MRHPPQHMLAKVALSSLLVALFAVSAPASHASSHAFSKGGVQVWVPKNWSVKNGAVFRATPPKKIAFVTVEVTAAKSLSRAKANVSELVRKYVGRPKLGKVASVKVGRFESVRVSGTGRMDGMPLIFDAYLYDAGGKILMGIGFAPSAVQPKFSAPILRILQSLRATARP